MSVWATYDVRIDGYDDVVYTGRNRSAAFWRAFSDFREHRPLSFADWLARATISKRAEPPKPDGYDSVRAQYGVYPTIGRRLRLINEGPMSGTLGTVIWPGRSTSMVHVVLDGSKHSCIVHPTNVEWLS